MNKNVIWLLVGILLFTLGLFQNIKYEEGSIKVDAEITRIKTRDDPDGDYIHTYYGSYEVDGVVYEDQKLDTYYGGDYIPPKSKGDTIRITVDPEKPERKVAEGGIFGTVGLVIVVYNIVKLVKAKKAKEQNTPC